MLDPMLAVYVEAQDDAEAERELELLLEKEAAPLVRKIASRKLGQFHSADIDDVVGEVTILLLERLQSLRSSPQSGPIAGFHDYVAAVAFNTCSHHLRLRHPERARLKNRVRYVLTTDERFDLWDTTSDGMVCGLRSWRGAAPVAVTPESVGSVRMTTGDPAGLRAVIDRIFRSAGGPIEVDRLVDVIGSPSMNVRSEVSLVADRSPGAGVLFDQRRFVGRLWAEVVQLPLRQRMALLLNLRDEDGSSVLWVFPLAGIASIRTIADALGIDHSEFATLWQDLPMDDNAIAVRLECTRQQVINLRLSARRRLRNRLGNLGAISLSMEGE